ALAILPVLVVIFISNEARRARLVRQLVALRLEGRLVGNVSVGKRRARFLLQLLGLTCIIISLTQPRWGYTWMEKKTRGLDVIIAMDTSRSMLANDLQPTRLLRAKLAAEDLIAQLAGNRIGLIAFAGSSFLQAPLTADQSAILNSLRELDTEVIPLGGTNIADAIQTAADAFGKGESENRALVIFTDGEELDTDGLKAAEERKDLFRIYTVGVGSKEGTVIALPDPSGGTDYLKDDAGQIVKSRLDETRLRAIAEAADGFYLHLQAGLADMQRLYREGLSTMNETEVDTRLSRQPIERYQWPLGAGMLLLVFSTLIGERRKGAARRVSTAAATALILLSVPQPAAASLNPGVDSYRQEQYKKALDQFAEQLQRQPKSPELQYNIGSAAYKAGDIDRALQAFSQALTATDPALRSMAAYNLGNTLVQRGLAQKEKKPKIQELKNALQHYDTALQANAKNEDAEYNRDVVRKLIEELEKEQQQEQQEQDKKDQEKKDQEKQDQKDQEKKDGKGDDKAQQQGGDKKDQPETGDQKDQQSGGDEKGEEQEGKGDEKGQPQEGKDGEPKEDKGGDRDSQEPKPGEGEDQQKADQSDKGQEGKDPKEQDGQSPVPPEEKKEGELKSNPAPGGEGDQPSEEEMEAAAEAAAAAAGQMTEAQAKALLESLKGEDDRVRLLNPTERRSRLRLLRDW
ncbi:MAG: VWA domain-containing protein, partial [Chthoniobacteraceae bacterium]